MRKNLKANLAENLMGRSLNSVIAHLIFFFMRITIFAVLYIETFYRDVAHTRTRVAIEDITYSHLLSVFVLYLGIRSITNKNIYKYYVMIIMLFHNSIISLIVLYEDDHLLCLYRVVYLSIFGTYLLEIMVSIALLYTNRNENCIELFKHIGINPIINNAYSTRKKLETMAEINVFMTTITVAKIWLPPHHNVLLLCCLKFINALFTYLQQLAISINFYDEDIIQRHAAFILSIVNIICTTIFFFWEKDIISQNLQEASDFFKFVYTDILIINIIILYFLIIDYNQFGSGLKEYMQFRTTRLCLSTTKKEVYQNPKNYKKIEHGSSTC